LEYPFPEGVAGTAAKLLSYLADLGLSRVGANPIPWYDLGF
jgi:hypothetical protein